MGIAIRPNSTIFDGTPIPPAEVPSAGAYFPGVIVPPPLMLLFFLSAEFRRVMRGMLVGAFVFWGAASTQAQNHFLERHAPGLIETGAPLFEIRTYQTLGLDSPPTDLHVLPDGRLLLFAGQQIAIGDGVRWERFQQAANDPLAPADTIAVDHDGVIYMGVVGGFARVEFDHDTRWHLHLVATWTNNDSTQVPPLRFGLQIGDDWFWHGDSGPLVQWRPGQSARVVGRADTTEQVLRLGRDTFLSDRTTGNLWRITEQGLVPVSYVPVVTSRDTLTCAVPYTADQLLVGTFGRGLKLFNGKTLQAFPHVGNLGEGTHINALCETPGGLFAAAVESYGLVFFNREGRTVQVLNHRIDHQLNHVRSLHVTGGAIVGLLSEGIVRVEFPSRLSYYEPLASTRLTTADPVRIDGRLWLSADGNMMRGTYDGYGLINGFEVDTPPGYFVFSVFNGMGMTLVTTEGGTFMQQGAEWTRFAPELNNMRVISNAPVDGRWMYAKPQEIGWLRLTGHGLELERFAAPVLGNPYGFETAADGTIWIEQGNARVIRVRVLDGKPVLEPLGLEQGLPEGWSQIFALDGRILFNMGGRILRFNDQVHRFEPDEQFARDFPGLSNIIGRPALDPQGRLWISTDGSVHVLERKDGQWQDRNEPMPPGFVPYSFVFEPNGVVWMHSDRRLVRYDPSLPRAPVVPFRALISDLNFIVSGRTLFPATAGLPVLDFSDNSFSAHFVAPNCPFGSSVDFEVKLDGVDSRWTSTGAGGSATFNHLKPGPYVLHVRPRAAGIVGGEASLGFTVRPPWYLTNWAYLGYALGVIALAVLIARTVSVLERRDKVRLERLVEERTQELNAGIERRRRLEVQLLQAQKLESLGTLAGGIAHDFNNILTSILGNCDLALMSAGKDSALNADLNQIRAAGVRARDLVAQILTFSRQRNIVLTPVNLAEPVADALRLIRASTPTTVEINSHLTDGNVQADSTQIHQIVINLCHNAVHAMHGHAGKIDVTLGRIEVTDTLMAELPGLRPGAAMQLSISDDGCGMGAATLERIFDPFFTTKAPGEGTGLGLSIVQGIVHGHNGVVRVLSEPGRGTTFDLYFPVTTGAVIPTQAVGQVPQGQGEEIMVVDDEPSVASYVARLLERLNYRPIIFSDPQAALKEILSAPQRYQAIVTDLTMPHLTGIDLVQHCRAAGVDRPVVIITGYGTESLQTTLQALARCKVLSKPFEGDDLARMLHRVLHDRETSPP